MDRYNRIFPDEKKNRLEKNVDNINERMFPNINYHRD